MRKPREDAAYLLDVVVGQAFSPSFRLLRRHAPGRIALTGAVGVPHEPLGRFGPREPELLGECAEPGRCIDTQGLVVGDDPLRMPFGRRQQCLGQDAEYEGVVAQIRRPGTGCDDAPPLPSVLAQCGVLPRIPDEAEVAPTGQDVQRVSA